MIEDRFKYAIKELRDYIAKCKGECAWSDNGEFEVSYIESPTLEHGELYSKLMKEKFPDIEGSHELGPFNKKEFIESLQKILFTVSGLEEISLDVNALSNKLFLDDTISCFGNIENDDDFLGFDFCFVDDKTTVLFMLYLQYD